MQNTAAIIEAVERLQPSSVYVEHDEQGRPRVVKLELIPRHGIGPDRIGLDREIDGAIDSELDVDAAVDRCADELLDIMRAWALSETAVQVVERGHFLGVLEQGEAAAKLADLEAQRAAAWARVRPALRALLAETER